MRPSLEQIWAELHRLHTQIHLKLPAPQQTVKQQSRHLTQVQQQLETLQSEVASRTSMTATSYLTFFTLTQLIQLLIQDITNLKHLAEEYPLDPEGTTACLQGLPKHTDALLTRLNPSYATHKHVLAHFLKNPSPVHKTQPALARQK